LTSTEYPSGDESLSDEIIADDDDDGTTRKRKKKGKEKEDEEPVEITGYIHVLKPTAPAPARSRVKVSPESLFIKRGQFKFMSDCSYDEFTTIMAEVLPCPPAHIVMDKVIWKPQTPANRTPLPLGGSVGFDVLQKQFRSRTKDRIVILTMPGPIKPAADAPVWKKIVLMDSYMWNNDFFLVLGNIGRGRKWWRWFRVLGICWKAV
jgi:hypothetical protein